MDDLVAMTEEQAFAHARRTNEDGQTIGCTCGMLGDARHQARHLAREVVAAMRPPRFSL